MADGFKGGINEISDHSTHKKNPVKAGFFLCL